jgi:multicomponent K+:H+ antiporter subunit D
VIEMAPIVCLLLLCISLTVLAGPAMRLIGSTARSLHSPAEYVGSVLAPVPSTLEDLR